MTSLAIIKLVSDALLFGALVFLSFRLLKKQPGSNINFAKLKELELSLKDVVREADEASQNFNEELITRRRDLEKVLTNSQATEARITKSADLLDQSIKEAELAKRDLEIAVNKSIEEFSLLKKRLAQENESLGRSRLFEQQSQHQMTTSRHSIRENAPQRYHQEDVDQYQPHENFVSPQRGTRPAVEDSIAAPTPIADFEYSNMLEPPSFHQISDLTEKRLDDKSIRSSPLSQRVERIYSPASQISSSSVRTRPIQDSLRSIATSAERSLESTKLPDHLEEALSNSIQKQGQTISHDPRLGVLAGTKRTSQVI